MSPSLRRKVAALMLASVLPMTGCSRPGGTSKPSGDFAGLLRMVSQSWTIPLPTVDELVAESELVAVGRVGPVREGRTYDGSIFTAVFEFEVDEVLAGRLPSESRSIYVEGVRSPLVEAEALDASAPRGQRVLVFVHRSLAAAACPSDHITGEGDGLPSDGTLLVPTSVQGVTFELANGEALGLYVDTISEAFPELGGGGFDELVDATRSVVGRLGEDAADGPKQDPCPVVPASEPTENSDG